MMTMKTDLCCKPVKENPLFEYGLSENRRPIWDLEHHYYCSIIGTCLSPTELSQLARKARLNISNIKSDYELHQMAVNLVCDENSRLAKLINKYLDKKYTGQISEVINIRSGRELKRFWKALKKTRDIQNHYWAVITHPLTSEELRESAFGHIHMLSHLWSSNVKDQEQELTTLKKKYSELESRFQQSLVDNRQRLKAKDAELKELKQNTDLKVTAQERDDTNLHRQITSQNLATQLERERLKTKQLTIDMQLLHSKNARLQDKLDQYNTRYSKSYNKIHFHPPGNRQDPIRFESTDKSELHTDLCGRCILYVGGRSRQCGRFKQIVQKLNGTFIHHDGGLENTNSRLDSVLSRADAIMCPLDCVSHNAMHKAKKHCKTNGKPLIMLEKSSLSAFEAGLAKV